MMRRRGGRTTWCSPCWQLEPKEWHSVIGDEAIADAVCDRMVHNAHRIKLTGEWIRKTKGNLTKDQKPAK